MSSMNMSEIEPVEMDVFEDEYIPHCGLDNYNYD